MKKEVLLSQKKQLYILYNTVHLPMSIQTTYIKVISISDHKVNILVEFLSEGVKTSLSILETCQPLLWNLCNNLMISSIFKEPVYFFLNFLKPLQKLSSYMFYRCPNQWGKCSNTNYGRWLLLFI